MLYNGHKDINEYKTYIKVKTRYNIILTIKDKYYNKSVIYLVSRKNFVPFDILCLLLELFHCKLLRNVHKARFIKG